MLKANIRHLAIVHRFGFAGRDADDRGFSYNLSLGGLYVRTLSPPEDDIVWVELRPPRSERRA